VLKGSNKGIGTKMYFKYLPVTTPPMLEEDLWRALLEAVPSTRSLPPSSSESPLETDMLKEMGHGPSNCFQYLTTGCLLVKLGPMFRFFLPKKLVKVLAF
jgi:hypothetical protein